MAKFQAGGAYRGGACKKACNSIIFQFVITSRSSRVDRNVNKPKVILESNYHFENRNFITSPYGKFIVKLAPDDAFLNTSVDKDFIPDKNAIFITRPDRNIRFLLDCWNEIIKKSDHIQHHPIITIDHLVVEIVLYTKELNDITDLDIKLSKYIDEIFYDISFIRSL